MADEYAEVKEYKSGLFHVRVYRPKLTEEERAKRMDKIAQAAASLLEAQLEAVSRKTKEKQVV